jgi:hypothetical protein
MEFPMMTICGGGSQGLVALSARNNVWEKE